MKYIVCRGLLLTLLACLSLTVVGIDLGESFLDKMLEQGYDKKNMEWLQAEIGECGLEQDCDIKLGDCEVESQCDIEALAINSNILTLLMNYAVDGRIDLTELENEEKTLKVLKFIRVREVAKFTELEKKFYTINQSEYNNGLKTAAIAVSIIYWIMTALTIVLMVFFCRTRRLK